MLLFYWVQSERLHVTVFILLQVRVVWNFFSVLTVSTDAHSKLLKFCSKEYTPADEFNYIVLNRLVKETLTRNFNICKFRLDEGVYVNTNGELVRHAVLQWGETPYAIGKFVI